MKSFVLALPNRLAVAAYQLRYLAGVDREVCTELVEKHRRVVPKSSLPSGRQVENDC